MTNLFPYSITGLFMSKKYGIIAAGAATAGVLAWNIIDTHRLTVSRYEIVSEKIRGRLKAVLVSDLHDTSFGRDNKRLKERIDRLAPDIILSAGDMITSEKRSGNRAGQEFMESLSRKYPVYAVEGNHENKMQDHPERFPSFSEKMYMTSLRIGGIRFPYDEPGMVWDSGIYVSALKMPVRYDRKFNRKRPDPEELKLMCPRPVEGAYNILLAHDPLYFEEYSSLGYDLAVSGHVHGGIIRLPGLGGLLSPDFSFFPKYDSGMYTEDGFSMIVSRGLGTHTFPVRIGNPAEIVEIEFRGV